MGPDVTRRVQSNQGEDDGVEAAARDVVDSVSAVKVGVDEAASAAAERSQPSKWLSSEDATAKRGDAAIRDRREESFIVAWCRGRGRRGSGKRKSWRVARVRPRPRHDAARMQAVSQPQPPLSRLQIGDLFGPQIPNSKERLL